MIRSAGRSVLVLAVSSVLSCGGERERETPAELREIETLDLKATAIVPTLDTPVERGKSAVWCATFQLAWNRLWKEILREPPIVRGAEALSKRLNNASYPEADLPEGTFYAAAGLMRDGIGDRIRKEMAAKFPAARPPDIGANRGTVAVAYAYLQAGLKFKNPFFDNQEPLHFADTTGRKTAVKSFGVRRDDSGAQMVLRDLVAVLHQAGDRGPRPEEFILDPSKDSDPVQLVLACIPWEETLERTIAAAEKRIAERKRLGRDTVTLGANDVLLVPNLEFKLQHHFGEIEGADKTFLNKGFEGFWIGKALQTILFQLDHSGVVVESEVQISVPSASMAFVFDRPFLVYMKKRSGGCPFFAVWIDDPELLVPWP